MAEGGGDNRVTPPPHGPRGSPAVPVSPDARRLARGRAKLFSRGERCPQQDALVSPCHHCWAGRWRHTWGTDPSDPGRERVRCTEEGYVRGPPGRTRSRWGHSHGTPETGVGSGRLLAATALRRGPRTPCVRSHVRGPRPSLCSDKRPGTAWQSPRPGSRGQGWLLPACPCHRAEY